MAAPNATTLPPSARDVAFVFQQYSLYPHLTVHENLAFPLKAPGRKLSKDEIARRVEATAKLVRIDHKLDSRATRLSAARCSASRSAGRWCASRRSI